jgi:integrase
MNLVQPIRNRADIERMKTALRGNPRDYRLFVLGINVGLRVSDLLRLKVGDIRGKTALNLHEKKTGKTKQLRFNSAVIELLRDLPGADDAYLFPSREGSNRPITRQTAYNVLNAAARRAGVDCEIGTHTMRKSFGYHRYKAGVPLETLQAVFNHSSPRETLRYIGIVQDDIDEVYEAVAL